MSSFDDFYSTPNIIRVIKSRIMRWAGRVAFIGDRRGTYRVLVGKPEGKRDHLEDPGIDGRIILRWIFKKWNGDMEWIDMTQDRDRWQAFVKAVMNI